MTNVKVEILLVNWRCWYIGHYEYLVSRPIPVKVCTTFSLLLCIGVHAVYCIMVTPCIILPNSCAWIEVGINSRWILRCLCQEICWNSLLSMIVGSMWRNYCVVGAFSIFSFVRV